MVYKITSSLKPNLSGTKECSVNRSYATPGNFRLIIEGDTFSSLEYTVKATPVPAISAPSVNQQTPFTTAPEPGSSLEYTPLEISFLVDEDFSNYQAAHDWLVINSTDQRPDVKLKRDMTLVILSSHFNPIKQIQFIDAFPTSLGVLNFDTSVNNVDYLVAQATFEYSYYKFI